MRTGQGRGSRTEQKKTSAFKTTAAHDEYYSLYDGLLKDHWPDGFEEHDLETCLGSTHIIASGSAACPPLILSHAMSMSSAMWYPNIRALSKEYRVYCVDRINEVGKSVCRTPPKSRFDYVQWMADILDGLGVKTARFVGISYGGFVTASFAAAHPERVNGIVLISPPALFARFRLRGLTKILRSFLTNMDLQTFQSLFFTPGYDYDHRLVKMMYIGARSYRILGWPVFPGKLSGKEYNAYHGHTLVLLGEKEVGFNPRSAFRTAKSLLPGADVEMVPHVGHLLTLQDPAFTNDRIMKFLQEGKK